jgi:hypothetical protein
MPTISFFKSAHSKINRKPADEWPQGGVFASCQGIAESPLHGDWYEIVGK